MGRDFHLALLLESVLAAGRAGLKKELTSTVNIIHCNTEVLQYERGP